MKKIISAVSLLISIISLAGCKNGQITIAVPNDLTNEARALLLLDQLKIIEVDKSKGLSITINDILNKNNIKVVELAADQIASRLSDFDYAVVNGNYALNAKIMERRIADCSEKNDSEFADYYGNVLASKKGKENDSKTIAVLNALKEENIANFIQTKYQGAVTSMKFNAEPILRGDQTKIKIGATSTPHAEILKECIPYLKNHGYLLEIVEFTDYVLPNLSLQDGSLDLNYFQHEPYLIEFNEKNKTDLVSIAKIHFEPLALYSKKFQNLEIITLL